MNHIVTDSEWKSRLHPAFGLVIDLDGVGGPYTIDRPFVVGGRVYATDRRICVRAPLPDGLVTEEVGCANLPPVEGLAWSEDCNCSRYALPPTVESPPPEQCRRCGGTGRCKECDGTGIDCGVCISDGDCIYCRRGIVIRRIVYAVPGADVGIAREHAEIVRTLGPDVALRSDGVFWASDGIVECMVMPCRCDSRGSRYELIRQ